MSNANSSSQSLACCLLPTAYCLLSAPADLPSVIQRFEYHCPFCGRIDSNHCAYINHPMDWKIQHSLRKPWSETVTTEIEEEVEKEVMEEREV